MGYEQRKTFTAAETANGETHNRQEQVARLYQRNYSSIVDAAHEDRLLLPDDAEAIVGTVASYLQRYDGPLANGPFVSWCRDIVRNAAKFYRIKRDAGDSVVRGIRSVLYKSADLRDVFGFSKDDRLDPCHAIESDVWLWVLEHLNELLIPVGAYPILKNGDGDDEPNVVGYLFNGKRTDFVELVPPDGDALLPDETIGDRTTAKLSTRLYSRARWQARAWKTARLRARDRFASLDALEPSEHREEVEA